jgi:menaquinone-9 beta-reductase
MEPSVASRAPSHQRRFDIVVIGGGLAGSIAGGVLAQAGLGVLILERERRFRDRIRGEAMHPWGVHEARLLGLDSLVERARVQALPLWRRYEGREPVDPFPWPAIAVGGAPAIGYSHPQFQEVSLGWAAEQGAQVWRPARAMHFQRLGGSSQVTIQFGNRSIDVMCRLAIGAGGRSTQARAWAGGTSVPDPEHHLLGGALYVGLPFADDGIHYGSRQGTAAMVIPQGGGRSRVYVVADRHAVAERGLDAAEGAFADFAASLYPAGTFETRSPAGPRAFFDAAPTWATRIAGDGIVLVGDAAGAPDPALGHGTSLLVRDARALTERLSGSGNWQRAIEDFARQRERAFETLRAIASWHSAVYFESGPEAERRRERHERAKARDETLAGTRLVEAQGPDGISIDESIRRIYFGDDVP